MNEILDRAGTDPALDTSEQLDPGQIELAGDLFKRRLWTAMRRALKQRGITQAQAAHCLSMKPSTLSRMISGPSNLTAEKASAIARSAGFYLSVNLEPVEASAIELKTVQMTATNFVKYISNQPGNCWSLTFERTDGVPVSTPGEAKRVGASQRMTAVKLGDRDWNDYAFAD